MIAVSKMYKQNLKQTWFQKRFPEIFFAFCKVKYAAAEGNSNHSPFSEICVADDISLPSHIF